MDSDNDSVLDPDVNEPEEESPDFANDEETDDLL